MQTVFEIMSVKFFRL